MNNPFETIEARLSNIENLLLDIKHPKEAIASQLQVVTELPDQLRSRDLKKLFGISSVSIWQWSKKGLLKPQLINGRNYFAKADVLKLLGQKSKGKKSPPLNCSK